MRVSVAVRRGASLPALARLLMCVAPPPDARGGHQGGRSVGQKRVRQHVNPLRSSHQTVLALPMDWASQAFARPELPLHVDVGSARGFFCLDVAEARPEVNVLGLEIRRPLAEAAQTDVATRKLGNAHFLATNANVNLQTVLDKTAPLAPLASVSIQFPDPHFKAKHHKRRVVQPALIEEIAAALQPGGWLWMQSDV